MKFYSTNNKEHKVSFKEAVFNSMPQDGGLYMPERIPVLDKAFIASLPELSFSEIAFHIASAIVEDAIPADALREIVAETVSFPAPVVALGDDTYVLELFHGPSLAFKDFGARFMSRVMSYLKEDTGKLLDVLVATSGDTGGAVALGFLAVPGTRVTILYPKGKVSPAQELQLTTNGQNIRAIEIDGSFDDCQALVKKAFVDKELNEVLQLTSANSINIARLIPQTFYYFNAYAQLSRLGKQHVAISVPSGNFGNIGAGILAWKMGLPVEQFVAATNANDIVPHYLDTGEYEPKKSVATLSNAMDVGNPSNWYRIMDMFGGDFEPLSKQVFAHSFTDDDTRVAIDELYHKYGYIACPHTAIGWLGLAQAKAVGKVAGNTTGLFLSTAHPCKFPEVFPAGIAEGIKVPESVQALYGKEKIRTEMSPDFEIFKTYLLEGASGL